VLDYHADAFARFVLPFLVPAAKLAVAEPVRVDTPLLFPNVLQVETRALYEPLVDFLPIGVGLLRLASRIGVNPPFQLVVRHALRVLILEPDRLAAFLHLVHS